MSRSSITARHRRVTSAEGTTTAVSRRVRVTAVAAATALSLGALGVWATSAGAAAAQVPVFPDNIVVFPDRDFVSVEGYEGYAGQVATLEVFRTGIGIVGSANATVAAGGVAFEVNHPGGVCWGEGTGLNVTPDIIPGDEVTLIIGNVPLGTTTVQDIHASDSVLQANGTTLVVAGRIAGLDPAQMEQRIVEPALVDTAIGKRDIRATIDGFAGPNGGYTSTLTVSGETFTATYLFDDPAVAAIAAAAGGERAMGWQVVDAAANRQGLTIAEFGEAGGPGFGGCPNGPLQSGPPAPTNIAAARVPLSASISVNWDPAVAIPGTQPITGYRVWAIDTTSNGGEQVEIGRRISNPLSTGTTITGLDPLRDYTIEVVSVSSVGETFPAASPQVVEDILDPIITASPAGGSYPLAQKVTLTANEPGVDIWYTTDGTDPIDEILSESTLTALPYTGAIDIAADTTLKFAGFDPSGNASVTSSEAYVITNRPTAAKTDILSATPGLNSVDLTWAAADPGAPGLEIVSYEVNVYDSSSGNAPPVVTVPFLGAGTSGTVTGLTGNQEYWFTVAGINNVNAAPGPESSRVSAIAQGPVVANAGPNQANVPRNTTVQLNGSGSTTGATVTYQWDQLTSDGLQVMQAGNANKVTIANPLAASTSFLLPNYNFAMTSGPLLFQLAVTDSATPETKYARVTITPRNDVVTVASARWKAGDFRVTGTGAINGAVITVRWITSAGVPRSATTTVVAGAWDLRLRNGAAPAAPGPAQIFVDSSQGGTFGPFNVVR